MAYNLAAKAPTEVVERRWPIPVDADDGPLSAVVSGSGVTVDDNSFDGNVLVLTLSGGSAATSGTITATITTSQGRTLVETLYIPIDVSTAKGDTAQDACLFALRKVFGLGDDPPADAMNDAMERLNDMIAEWDETGARTGVPYPLTTATVFNVNNSFLRAIKYNLTVSVAEQYGRQLSADIVLTANKGLAHIKQTNLPDERPQAGYY